MLIDRAETGSRPAPGRLALVQAFVNTLDVESGSDRIDSPEALRAWLVRHGLLAEATGAPTPDDVVEVHALREALRAILLAHHSGDAEGDAIGALNRIAARAPLILTFEPDGATRLRPRGSALDGAIAQLLAPVHDAVVDGTWTRLKACRNDACAWAYYDTSKNRSSAWCSMAVCGNRMKSRAYRQRRSADT